MISRLLGHYNLDPFCVAVNTSLAFFAFSDVQRIAKIKSVSRVILYLLIFKGTCFILFCFFQGWSQYETVLENLELVY